MAARQRSDEDHMAEIKEKVDLRGGNMSRYRVRRGRNMTVQSFFSE